MSRPLALGTLCSLLLAAAAVKRTLGLTLVAFGDKAVFAVQAGHCPDYAPPSEAPHASFMRKNRSSTVSTAAALRHLFLIKRSASEGRVEGVETQGKI